MNATAHALAAPNPEMREDGRILDCVRAIAGRELAPLVDKIDREGHYPEAVLRSLGAAGAYRTHLAPAHVSVPPHLGTAIEASALVSQSCLSTGFLMWCQDTLAWYLANSNNEAVRVRYLPRVADGIQLGGTGLSNPMKALFGIERMRLKGRRVVGGYAVRGALPWVSNLGPDHVFGTIFELETDPSRRVMFVADCAAEGISIQHCPGFLALDGTATYAVQFRDAFVPDAHILSDPIDDYIKKIRAGFILLQAGMGIGIIRDCAELIERLEPTLGHINMFLMDQAGDIRETLLTIEAETAALASSPHDQSPDYWRRVLMLRLRVGETAVRAAHAAILHSGARGYVRASRVQRRLREAYFVAILTPATKQLKKMLAETNG
jgi:alkylation response protein AidB-like acyl-CoA dehydrogenase